MTAKSLIEIRCSGREIPTLRTHMLGDFRPIWSDTARMNHRMFIKLFFVTSPVKDLGAAT